MHRKMIENINKLYYSKPDQNIMNKHDGGVCNGLSFVFAVNILIGKPEQFTDTQRLINKNDLETLQQRIEEVLNKVKEVTKQQQEKMINQKRILQSSLFSRAIGGNTVYLPMLGENNILRENIGKALKEKLTPEEKLLLAALSHFEAIELFQQESIIRPEIFSEGKQIQDGNIVLPLVLPADFEKAHRVVNIASFVSCNDDNKELSSYLENLLALNIEQPFVVVMSGNMQDLNGMHAIAIGKLPNDSDWFYFNANEMTEDIISYKLNNKTTCEHIFAAYHAKVNERLPLSIEIVMVQEACQLIIKPESAPFKLVNHPTYILHNNQFYYQDKTMPKPELIAEGAMIKDILSELTLTKTKEEKELKYVLSMQQLNAINKITNHTPTLSVSAQSLKNYSDRWKQSSLSIDKIKALHDPVLAIRLATDLEEIKRIYKLTKDDPKLTRDLLFYSIQHGYADAVKFMLNEGVDATAEFPLLKLTPFLFAVAIGDLPICKLLLANYAHLIKKEGEVALSTAVSNGHIHVVEFLLAQGVNCTKAIKDEDEVIQPIVRAAKNGHGKIVELLLTHYPETADWKSLILEIIATRNLEAMKLILDKKPKLLANNPDPLYLAAKVGQLEMVELLLKYGAGSALSIATGETPLAAAVAGNHLKVVKCLVDNYAPVDDEISDKKISKYKYSLLLYALLNNLDELAKLLFPLTNSKQRYDVPLKTLLDLTFNQALPIQVKQSITQLVRSHINKTETISLSAIELVKLLDKADLQPAHLQGHAIKRNFKI